MYDHQDEDQESSGPTWRMVATGAVSLLVLVSGYLIGTYIATLRDELKDIRATLNERANLPPRVDALEREHGEYQRRLSQLERDVWTKQTK